MPLPWKQRKQGYEIQEARLARKPGARPQLNSGRTWSGRGDVKQISPVANMLIDAKDHSNSKSYRITEAAWENLKSIANRTPPGCQPSLHLNVGKCRLVVIEEDLWDEINERLSEVR